MSDPIVILLIIFSITIVTMVILPLFLAVSMISTWMVLGFVLHKFKIHDYDPSEWMALPLEYFRERMLP